MNETPTRLLLIRHGQVASNAAGRLVGALDPPLDATGRVQASRIASSLASLPLAAVISSPLTRAIDTAAAIAAHHHLEPMLDARLAEIHLGAWEGLARDDVTARFPGAYEAWRADPSLAAGAPGGESFAGLLARVRAALADVVATHRGEAVAIVSHAGAIRAAVLGMLGLAASSFYALVLDNASVTEIQCLAGRAYLVRLNVPPGCAP